MIRRSNHNDTDFSSLVGLTIASIEGMKPGEDEIHIKTACGRHFMMFHEQDCCESVSIEDVVGEVQDLIGMPILLAEESVSEQQVVEPGSHWSDECQWTFYKLATINGYVDLRWYGTSNGYYSMGVSFYEVMPD